MVTHSLLQHKSHMVNIIVQYNYIPEKQGLCSVHLYIMCVCVCMYYSVDTPLSVALSLVKVPPAHDTVEPPKRGQCGDEPFVLSREVVLFWRFLFLSLKMKHF